MATFDDLLPGILVEVDGCSQALAEKSLQQVIRNFCRDTHYWKLDIDPITLIPFVPQAPDTYIYTVPVPEGTELVAIDVLSYQHDTVLQPESSGWLDEHMMDWRTSVGEPRYYIRMSSKTVRFVPHSQAVQPVAIRGRVVLRPDLNTRSFGDELLEYDHGLQQGCLHDLLTMRRPWANPGRAAICRADYQEALSQAKMDVMREFSDKPEVAVRRTWL